MWNTFQSIAKQHLQLYFGPLKDEGSKEGDSHMHIGGEPKGMSWTEYHSHATIDKFVTSLADDFPDKAELHVIGQSWENRDLKLLRITNDLRVKKPGIWIDGGIHAREWISPAAVTYMMREFVVNSQKYPILDHYDLYILPLINPDGYEFTRTDGHFFRKFERTIRTPPFLPFWRRFIIFELKGSNRFWRKNRRPFYPWPESAMYNSNCRLNPWHSNRQDWKWCPGVDLNRNFDTPGWSEVGPYYDDEIYAGAKPFSEPETRAVRDFLLDRKGQFRLFLTFHSFGQLILCPSKYETKCTPLETVHRKLAEKGAEAAKKINGTKYQIGPADTTLYPAAGTSRDWAYLHAGIKYSYTIELPPRKNRIFRKGGPGFDLPASDIVAASEEALAITKAMIEALE